MSSAQNRDTAFDVRPLHDLNSNDSPFITERKITTMRPQEM
jgi:hypothetical protein